MSFRHALSTFSAVRKGRNKCEDEEKREKERKNNTMRETRCL